MPLTYQRAPSVPDAHYNLARIQELKATKNANAICATISDLCSSKIVTTVSGQVIPRLRTLTPTHDAQIKAMFFGNWCCSFSTVITNSMRCRRRQPCGQMSLASSNGVAVVKVVAADNPG